MANAGDKVKVFYKKEVLQGVLMPDEDSKFLFVKLKNGYNIGLNKKQIKKVDVVSSQKTSKKEISKISTKKGLPTISLLHTGGTIASKVDYSTGAVIAKFTEDEILNLFPEIKEFANINSKLIRNMQSEMMRIPHYNLLAKVIEAEAKKGVDGIILTHGTDTLHYTGAALSFVLENLGIPVILVGSQRSSDRGSTDGAVNLIAASQFIANSDFSGVAICMHENSSDNSCLILNACKARKMHTSRRDAFRPINTKPIARVDVEKKSITFLSDYQKKDKKKKITLKLFNEQLKIGILKAHVNMYASEILAYKDFDGLVLELMGIGHIPTMKVDEFTSENERILKAVLQVAKNIPIVASPQTIYGRIDMNMYTPGRQLLDAGVLGNYSDMTPETTYIKLAWLLSNCKKEELKTLFSKNIRGEISDRSEKEGFLR